MTDEPHWTLIDIAMRVASDGKSSVTVRIFRRALNGLPTNSGLNLPLGYIYQVVEGDTVTGTFYREEREI